MNRDQAINDLESKLATRGYVHPDTHQGPSADPYAVINVKEQNAVYQRSTKPVIPYASFTPNQDTPNEKTVNRPTVCPVCDNKALYMCECTEFKDMMCKNSHVWWVNTAGQIINGDPHVVQ